MSGIGHIDNKVQDRFAVFPRCNLGSPDVGLRFGNRRRHVR